MIEKKYSSETYIKPFGQYLIDNYTDRETLIGVEIGVAQGFHAMGLLTNLKNLKKLYLIDPYESYIDRRNIHYSKGNVISTMEYFRSNILDNPEFNDRYIFIRNYSKSAVVLMPNDLDFVYIDGSHNPTVVRSDIELYYPKVKSGGLFGGDDYNKMEVIEVVDEFIEEYNLKLYTQKYIVDTSKNKQGWMYNIEWWIIKE